MITCFITLSGLYLGQPATVQDCFAGDQSVGQYLAVGTGHNIKVFKFTGQMVKYAEHKRQMDAMAADYLKQKQKRNKYYE